jgi:hypothetical protein
VAIGKAGQENEFGMLILSYQQGIGHGFAGLQGRFWRGALW